MRLWLLLFVCLAFGCASPPGGLLPTRTPAAKSVAVGVSLERSLEINRDGQPKSVAAGVYRGDDSGDPLILPARPRGWVAYSVDDRAALSATVSPIGVQAAVQMNPIRTRHLDLSGTLRAGYETLYAYSLPGGISAYAHTAAIVQLGLNPIERWLTFQLQGGVWTQHLRHERSRTDDERGIVHDGAHHVGPWLGGNVYVIASDTVAVGMEVIVLPGWFDFDKPLVQPSLSLILWPMRNSNPYRNAR